MKTTHAKQHTTPKHWLVVAVIVSIFISCGRNVADAPILTAADSLIATTPDSALALLNTINPDTLTGKQEANRAYHALLTAQAQWFSDVLPTHADTAAIDSAAHFYAGTPREARALIYAGTTRETLGDLTGAITRYKRAEITATATRDTFNAAYAQLRMATIYHANFAPSEAIAKYSLAAEQFADIADSTRLLACLTEIGRLSQAYSADSFDHYLTRADRLALTLGDSDTHYNILASRAEFHYNTDSLDKAIDEAEQLIEEVPSEPLNYTARAIAACAYILKGRQVQATKMLNSLRPITDRDSMWWFRANAEYRRVFENGKDYATFSDKAVMIADTIQENAQAQALIAAEHNALEQKLLNNAELQRTHLIAAFIALALTMIIGIVIYVRLRRSRKLATANSHLINHLTKKLELTEQEVQRYNQEKEELQQSHTAITEQLKFDSQEQAEIHKQQIQQLEGEVEQLNTQIDSSIESIIEIFKALKNEFKNLRPNEMRQVVKTIDSRQMFYIFEQYLRRCKPRVITFLNKRKHNLNAQDRKIFILDRCGFSNYIIAAFLGYTNEHSVSQRKKDLAKKLFGENGRIEQLNNL